MFMSDSSVYSGAMNAFSSCCSDESMVHEVLPDTKCDGRRKLPEKYVAVFIIGGMYGPNLDSRMQYAVPRTDVFF